MTTSGRPFELIDVRVVGEDGQPVAKGSHEVRGMPHGKLRYACCAVLWLGKCTCSAEKQTAVALLMTAMSAGLPPPPASLQVGEVWVRGPTVFSGYFGLPNATAEAFAEGSWFK